jgi:hypothetical protein
MTDMTLCKLETCLDKLANLTAECENEHEFLNMRWFFNKKKISPLIPEVTPHGIKNMIRMNPNESSYDRPLKDAFIFGKIMLQHIQKMFELVVEYKKHGWQKIGPWTVISHVLMGRNPKSHWNFSVFWSSYLHAYVYSDQTGYTTFTSVPQVLHHLQNGDTVLEKKDTFFRERFTKMHKFDKTIKNQFLSRSIILTEYNNLLRQCRKKHISAPLEERNIYNPLKGHIGHFTYYIFYDQASRLYRFYKYNGTELCQHLQSETANELFLRMCKET